MRMAERLARPPTAGVLRTMPPRWIFSLMNPVAKFLLAAGIPLGPNGLVTVRGRTSGLPRTTPVGIIEVAGRRWIWCPWGEVHWVRNLRAAGRATITKRGRTEEVTAIELDRTQRVAFFRETYAPLVRGVPFGPTFVRIIDSVDIDDPQGAAKGRCVFELHMIP
jgi:deazaflavin-dependent oxidoreductase (nitroreductase family)